jgi:iron complex outermembrane receptor protein
MSISSSKMLFHGVSCAALLLSGAFAPSAIAQESAQQSAASGAGLEEIVVTARRREEKLQTVPIAISAVGGESLTEHSIANGTDLGKLIPALSTSLTNRDLEGYEIRGMSNNNASAQGQSPVITPYFAEVPFPVGDGGGLGRFYDLDNIQVLKGPQGTLFGRNATGGAVLFQPKKPNDNYEGYIQGRFGNYNDREFQGAVNIPIIADKLMVRVAGERAERDGFTKDPNNGKDYDNRDYWSGRASVTFRPTDDFENYFVADSLYTDTNGSSIIIGAFNPNFQLGSVAGLPLLFTSAGPSAASAATPAGRAAAAAAGSYAFFPQATVNQILAQQAALGPHGTVANNNPLEKYWSWGLTDIATWNVSDNITVRNIFGYREYKQALRFDQDGTVLPVLDQYTPSGWSTDLGQYTEEAQIQGKSLNDSLVWVVGAFGLLSHSTAFGGQRSSLVHPTARSEAAYAQGTYDLGHSIDALEGLKFTGGYRYTWDYRSLDQTARNAAGACTSPGADRNCDISVSSHTSQFSWTAGLDYQVTPGTLLYVTARRGFRAGGLNTQSLILSQIGFKPETVQDVEIGVKSDWELYGVKARTNVAAFHTDYKNKQASQAYTATINGQLITTNLIVNAGNVTIDGLEADFTFIPVNGLELTTSWAYNQAKFDKYLIVSTGQSVPGETYPFVPPNKLSFNARYQLPVPEDWGDLFASTTVAYQSHQYLGVQASDPAFSTIGNGYTTIDLALDWKNILNHPVDVSLFATNVTDTVYKLGGIPVYGVAGYAAFVYGEPRMYGARIKYRFGGPSAEPVSTPAAYVPPPVVAPAPVAHSYMVFFDFNKSDLTPQAVTIVNQAAANAGPAKATQLTVTGHTDTVGSDAYNMRLSRRRAESVAAQLEKDGIPSSEIEIVAKGKRDLLVPTADGVKEPQNRRVQIVYSDGPNA